MNAPRTWPMPDSELRCNYCGSWVTGLRCSQCGATRPEVEQDVDEVTPVNCGDGLLVALLLVGLWLLVIWTFCVSSPGKNAPIRANKYIPLWQNGDDDLMISGTLRISQTLVITGNLE